MKPSAEPKQVVYGTHAVRQMLSHRPKDVLSLLLVADSDGGSADHFALLAQQAGIAPRHVNRGELDRLTESGVHQGVAAVCVPFQYETDPLVPLLLAQKRKETPLCLLLDGVTDPQNVGALLRSACVLGAHGVVLPQDRSAPITKTAIKAAAGATAVVPIVRVPNLVRAMEVQKEAGLWFLAAVAPGQGGRPVWTLDLTVPLGLLLGGEEKGLRPLVRKHCDLRAEIPMPASLHGASLNVSSAGAVFLYECLRQRSQTITP